VSGEEVLTGEGKRFKRTAKSWKPCPLAELPDEILSRAREVGVKTDGTNRAGSYFQIDHSVILAGVQKAFEGKVEAMSVREALERYRWVKDLMWSLVSKDADEYTRLAAERWDDGYFFRVLKNQRVTIPLQACLFISTEGLNQNVHNIVIAEPGSEIQMITGCTVHPNVGRGLHVGVTEFFVRENARLTFTMIHSWGDGLVVRPRSAALLEEGATFVSNYVSLRPVESLQMFPAAYCRGRGSRAVFNSIIYSPGDSKMDVGSRIFLEGAETKGEIVSRVIAADSADITARGLLVGRSRDCRGHLECMGLMLSERGRIRALPELLVEVEGAELSHEAAVGKIAGEHIFYLMSRGFSEDEARSLIVKGFMSPEILGLPEPLKVEIDRMIELAMKGRL
jgi:Fe-S cluster assembly scaffold protein SufB